MSDDGALEDRLAAVVGGVLRQLLIDSGAAAFCVVGGDAPEAVLARRWIVRAAGADALRDEPRAGVLVADPVNKTALLLDAAPRPASVLPLGDLYATQVAQLTGGWSAPGAVLRLAEQAGGVHVLDRALTQWVERREPLDRALHDVPAAAAAAVRAALEAARFARRRVPLVPRLAWRTAGIDLFA